MSDSESSSATPTRRSLAIRLLAAVLLLTALVTLAGVGLAAMLAQRGVDDSWSRWSDVGESFGAVNSVVSALAVAAVLVTWALQSRDLTVQRHILEDAQAILHRSFDVEVRKLHVQLTRMAIENPQLAAVWPSLGATDKVTQSQHMYANLLLQHAHLQYTTGVDTREELISNLRFLFASPKIRSFWRDTASSRRSIYVEGTAELNFAGMAEEIWREYETVLACSTESGYSAVNGSEWATEPLPSDDGDVPSGSGRPGPSAEA